MNDPRVMVELLYQAWQSDRNMRPAATADTVQHSVSTDPSATRGETR